jgi:hypothetical protein
MLGGLAVIFWFTGPLSMAFWLAVLAAVELTIVFAWSRQWPKWLWTLLEKRETISLLLTLIGVGAAWWLSELTGDYMKHAIDRVIGPVFALMFGK